MTAPVAFTFLPTTPSTLPSNLLPTLTAFTGPSSSTPVSVQSSPRKRPVSLSPGLKPQQQRSTNYQDVLIFDPLDGNLTLHRLTVSTRSARDHDTSTLSSSLMSALPLPSGTSMSFPGMGMFSKTSTSPTSRSSNSTPSALSRMMERREDATKILVAKEAAIASWSLSRSLDWREVKVKLDGGYKSMDGDIRVPRSSRAE